MVDVESFEIVGVLVSKASYRIGLLRKADLYWRVILGRRSRSWIGGGKLEGFDRSGGLDRVVGCKGRIISVVV